MSYNDEINILNDSIADELSEHVKARILVEALPYIQSLAGKTVVIKYGGNAMIDESIKDQVITDVTLLKFIGLNPILVHGGGPDINQMLETLEIKSEFVNGLRVTTEEIMQVVQMVLVGKTNKEIVSLLTKHRAKAIGLSGIDGGLLRCKPYRRKDCDTDYGYVGDIIEVNTELLETLNKADFIPVIAPIGIDNNGKSYNINADTVAAEVAKALKAEKLMVMTDVSGVKRKLKDGSEEVIPVLTETEINELLASEEISGGMIPKVKSCLDVVSNGVGRAHIIDGRIPHCLLLEIFTLKGIGTMITKTKRPYHPGENL